jgi:hypothetical protein
MPHEVGAVGNVDPFELTLAFQVEQTQLDPIRVLRVQREIHTRAVPRRAKGRRLAAPDRVHGGACVRRLS